VLGAERDHALAMLGGEDDVAGDEDHRAYLSSLCTEGCGSGVVKSLMA
jgi:hypothetical protein